MRRAVRAIAISDLHLGGSAPAMMSVPQALGDFIEALPARLAADEQLELLICGDFVDFLAITPFADFTADAAAARSKLERTMCEPPFACVFDALRGHIAAGHHLTVLLGNHDLELALPGVQHAFLDRIAAGPHQVHFVDDGRAYRLGRALFEHGNRYDPANENDWDGLRALASHQSRGESEDFELHVSAGSRIVERVVNSIKGTYPFIDLLQPQGELVAFLLFALEPALLLRVADIARLMRGGWLQGRNAKGAAPGTRRAVANSEIAPVDRELQAAFGPTYEALRPPAQSVADVKWLPLVCRPDGLAALLAAGKPVPKDRLAQIRVVLRKLLAHDDSQERSGATAQYGAAAQRLSSADAELQAIVMGHTHLPRMARLNDRCTYVNTGTWADRVLIDAGAIDTDDGLNAFLRDLVGDKRRPSPRTYAELRVEPDGRVSACELLEILR